MTHRENLALSKAAELFYYEEASVDLVIQMMDNKVEIDKIAVETEKQLKKLSETVKPNELEPLEKEMKELLDSGKMVDDVQVRTLQTRINLLQAKWNEKYTEGEETILGKSVNVVLKKISKEDLKALTKARKELVEVEKDKKREVIVTNVFKTSHFAALRPLLQDSK